MKKMTQIQLKVVIIPSGLEFRYHLSPDMQNVSIINGETKNLTQN
jgi:hypothetical protein